MWAIFTLSLASGVIRVASRWIRTRFPIVKHSSPKLGPFTKRLPTLTSLSDKDLATLAQAADRAVDVAALTDIIPEGAGTDSLHVVLEGWACRYKLLPDGRRLIPALVLPGDVADLGGFLFRVVHSGVSTLTRCRVATLPHARLRGIVDRSPTIRDALWRLTSVETSMSTQWTLCLGRMSAEERLAHLFCELYERLSAVGHAEGGRLPFPLTQEVLSDVIGVSVVHLSRTLNELRSAGLVSLEGRRLAIHDPARLASLGNFDRGYLHLDLKGPPDHPQAKTAA